MTDSEEKEPIHYFDDEFVTYFEDELFGRLKDESNKGFWEKFKQLVEDNRHVSSRDVVRLHFTVHNPQTQQAFSDLALGVRNTFNWYVYSEYGEYLDQPDFDSISGQELIHSTFRQYAEDKGITLKDKSALLAGVFSRETNAHLDDIEFCAESLEYARLGAEFYAKRLHLEAARQVTADLQQAKLAEMGYLQCDLDARA